MHGLRWWRGHNGCAQVGLAVVTGTVDGVDKLVSIVQAADEGEAPAARVGLGKDHALATQVAECGEAGVVGAHRRAEASLPGSLHKCSVRFACKSFMGVTASTLRSACLTCTVKISVKLMSSVQASLHC